MGLAKACGYFAISLLLSPVAASAQYRETVPNPGYRDGLPDVISPPPAADPDAASVRATSTFRRWYAGARKPAMLIFWNRELSDEATTRYADVNSSREETRVVQSGSGGAMNGETLQSKISSSETSKRSLSGGKFAPMDSMLSSQLESAFQNAWLASGVELVDRTALIRKMSTVANKDDRSDGQFMESIAIEQGVSYLVEILPTATPSSPTGLVFLVRIKHLPSATLVAQFNTPAAPPSGPAVWVATSGGFEKRLYDRTSPETIGAELAVEAMGRFH